MELRLLDSEQIHAGWEINEQGLPGTGQITEKEFEDLMDFSDFSVGAFDGNALLGFVICLLPNTGYGSLNYAWFNQKYQDFLYVDRIAVAQSHRNRGVGTLLYQSVFKHAQQLDCSVAAEVNLTPPNPGSERFHQRHGFEKVGEFHHQKKSVTMLLRPKSLS